MSDESYLQEKSKAEFNWHPKLHAHEGELLWFFLIRFEDPTAGPLEDQIRAALNRAGLRHACMYALYGYWDGLLRIWMTVDVKRKFLRLMKASPNEFGVDDIRDFEVSGLYYMWLDQGIDLLEEDKGPSLDKLTAFEDVVRSARGDVGLVPPDTRATLRANDMLIERPPWPRGGIKLYIALDYTATASVGYDLEVSLVRDAIRGSGLADRCSLYVGAGFSRFLLRCTADNYDAVLSQTQCFYEQLRDLHAKGLPLRPTTFVIIEASEESDNLNVFESLSMSDESTAQRLDLTEEGRERFSKMPPDERSQVHRLVVRVDELALKDSRLSSALIGLLRACIEGNYPEVTRSLSFLIDVEWLYREYMIRVWARLYGNDWRDVLCGRLVKDGHASEDGAKQAKGILDRPPNQWSFGDVHKLAEISSQSDANLQSALTEEIGRNWSGRLHALLALRNFTMHGYVHSVGQLSDLSGDWGDKVGEAIRSAEIYFQLDSHLKRGEILQ